MRLFHARCKVVVAVAVIALTGAACSSASNGSSATVKQGGVLRIGYLSAEIAQIGIWSLISFAAMLSVNLGLVNLFPIPLLDGGHLTYYAIEAVRGKPLGERIQEWGFRIGVAFVLGIMLFATWNDLVFLDVIGKLRALFT